MANITGQGKIATHGEGDQSSHNLITIGSAVATASGWRITRTAADEFEIRAYRIRLKGFSFAQMKRALRVLGKAERYQSRAHAASQLDFYWYYIEGGSAADIVL